MSERVPDPHEADGDPAIAELADRLWRSRPEPGARLRTRVRTFLSAADASGLLISRPRHLWLRVAACMTAGSLLLALVAAGVGHWGLFAP